MPGFDMIFKKLFFLGGLLIPGLLSAQTARKYSNEFLNIGVSARGFGMSNSVVASTDDVTGGYWNPAALAGVEDRLQVSLMHAAYFSGIANYDYGAIAAPLKNDKGVVGVSFVRFGIDGIANTFDLIQNGVINYDRITTFSAVDYAFLFSYARTIKINSKNKLQLGGNAKVIYRKVGPFANAWGFGLDAGVRFISKSGLMLAATARDVTSTFNAWNFTFTEQQKQVLDETGNDIPQSALEITLPRLILAAAKKINLNKSGKFTLLAEVDLDATFDGKRNVLLKSSFASVDPHLGLEAGYRNLVFLRAGVGNIQQEMSIDGKKQTTFQPNIGLGLHLGNVFIDYALSDVGNASAALYSNVFSLKLAIPSRN